MVEHEAQRWAVLYRAALLELDRSKLPQRIREANEAIQQQLQGLRQSGAVKNSSEQQALEDALHNLRVLARM